MWAEGSTEAKALHWERGRKNERLVEEQRGKGGSDLDHDSYKLRRGHVQK